MLNFCLTQGLTHVLQLLLGVLLGRRVRAGQMRVHDTRKVMHFCLFLAPVAIGAVLQHERTPIVFALSGLSFLISLLVLVEPIRRRVPLLETAFAAIDRPEDRPHSLAWMITQLLGDYAAISLSAWWLAGYGHPQLIFVVALAICFGDGLAEPIGVRYGRHRYPVPSLARGRQYHRSVEGSAVVLLASLAVVLACGSQFPTGTFVAAAIALPIALTLAEALAPHTWDGPVMYLVGGATMVGVLEFAG